MMKEKEEMKKKRKRRNEKVRGEMKYKEKAYKMSIGNMYK